MFKIPLLHEMDNATSYFLISTKNLKYKQDFHADTFWNYLILYMALWWNKYQGGNEEEARGTAEQTLCDRPPLIKSREIYSA